MINEFENVQKVFFPGMFYKSGKKKKEKRSISKTSVLFLFHDNFILVLL